MATPTGTMKTAQTTMIQIVPQIAASAPDLSALIEPKLVRKSR